MSTSPAEPQQPPEPSPWDYRPGEGPDVSPWDEDEGAMDAEDRYLDWLEGPRSWD